MEAEAQETKEGEKMNHIRFQFADGSHGAVRVCFEAEGIPFRGYLLEGRMPEPFERFNAAYTQNGRKLWEIAGVSAIVTTSKSLEQCGVGLYGIDLYNPDPSGP